MSQNKYDIAVIGAGPQGIGVAAYSHILGGTSCAILDSLKPLEGMTESLERLGITQLRSSGSQGLNYHIWRNAFLNHGRQPVSRQGGIDYYSHQPQLSAILQRESLLWQRTMKSNTIASRVTLITREGTDFRVQYMGGALKAKNIIIAPGIGTPHIPDSFRCIYKGNSRIVHHTGQIDLRDQQFVDSLRNEHIGIVGAGESSASAVNEILRRQTDCTVTLVTRNDFHIRQTEIDPYYFTPGFRNWFISQNQEVRSNLIILGRNRSSMTPYSYATMISYMTSKRLNHIIDPNPIMTRGEEGKIQYGETVFDRLILGTGYRYCFNDNGVMDDSLVGDIEIDDKTGLPVITEKFMAPKVQGLYFTGRCGELRSGPGGRNLWHAFATGEIIYHDITGRSDRGNFIP